MKFNSKFFLSALALAVFLEGFFYTLAAPKLPAFFKLMSGENPALFRRAGLAAMLIALFVLWLLHD